MRSLTNEFVPVGHSLFVGDVVEFDEERGLGTVEYGRGSQLPFHCTAITDGSRTIAAGAVVAFAVAAGRLGRLEARLVRPLPGVVPPGSTLGTGFVSATDSDHPTERVAQVHGAGPGSPPSSPSTGSLRSSGSPPSPSTGSPGSS